MRTLYIVCALCVAVVALLFEEGLLPVDFLGLTTEVAYVFDLLCVALTFGGVFVALRLFKFKVVQQQLDAEDTDKAFAAYRTWNTLRISMIFFPMFWNLIVYYGSGFNQSAMYCLLITVIGALFCWPTSKP
jgi:hypothetical protein